MENSFTVVLICGSPKSDKERRFYALNTKLGFCVLKQKIITNLNMKFMDLKHDNKEFKIDLSIHEHNKHAINEEIEIRNGK